VEQNIEPLDYDESNDVAKERLITIGEDKDEDKNFDTNKENSKISKGTYQPYA